MRRPSASGILGLVLLGATLLAQPSEDARAQDAGAVTTQPATRTSRFDERLKTPGGAAATQPATRPDPELGKLRAELAALRAENARLKAEMAKLKVAQATTAPAPKPSVAGGPADEIKKAINEHRIVNGMTIEQANKSLSVKFAQASASASGEVYVAVANWKQTPIRNVGGRVAGGDITGTEYTLEVKGGIVTYWSSKPYHADPGTFRSSP